ncbi:MAG: hypothetical protein IPH53_12690 [Flavobacteriales bacterium]|nr:hypothetical protein [Flavobacteriales bacterium]
MRGMLEDGVNVRIGFGRPTGGGHCPRSKVCRSFPPCEVFYKGKRRKSSTDTLLLHPEWVVVDELAHTNARQQASKWYQDLLRLLDNGINVITAVNIQHREHQRWGSTITGVELACTGQLPAEGRS